MPTAAKEVLERLSGGRAPGPLPTFNVLHAVKTLEILAREGIVGRFKLSQELDIGEGSVRTLLKRMKEAGLVQFSRSGCALTSKGRDLWNEINSKIATKAEINKTEVTVGSHNVAILVRGAGNRVTSGVEQRDAAIKAGALGATTLVVRGGRLVIPMISEDVSKDFPEAYRQVMETLRPQEGDAIVIGSADEPRKAEYGALAAAWTLL